MKKFKFLFLFTAAMLSLTGCPNDTSNGTEQQQPGGGGNTSTKISGLQANITVNAYMGNTQYSINLDASKGTFKAIPLSSLQSNQISGRGDDTATEITGSFVCNKTAAGDDLYWYAHNSAICLKPDSAANTGNSCYKIIADLTTVTGTDGSSTGTDTTAKTVNITNKYCTKTITASEYTTAETAAQTPTSTSAVTFTDAQKNCLKKANTELEKCTKKEVSSLTQTFDADGNTTKDYTVGFSFNLGDTTCDVFIDKNNVAISTDESSDFSRTTPTWLMSAIDTVITSGASPDDIKNCDGLKDCTALQTVITELASTVGTSNNNVVYTESGKDGYKEMPCPWSEDELAKMKEFTENYSSNKKEIGAYCHGYMSDKDRNTIQIIEKFSNEDAFAVDSNGKRTKSELIYILNYSTIQGIFPDGTYSNDDEHVFGVKVTVDLEGINKLLPLNEWTNPSLIYDYFTFSKAEACDSTETLTWRKTTDFETNQDTIDQVTYYEETPQWFLDMINTYTSKDHTDYDRQYNIGGTGCPLSYIGSVWLDEMCYEYLYGPNFNTGYWNWQYYVNVYEKDLSNDEYPSTSTQWNSTDVKDAISSGEYEAYQDANESNKIYTTDFFICERNAKTADGKSYYDEDGFKMTSYTTNFYFQEPFYMKKICYDIVYLQKNGDTFSTTSETGKMSISEIRQIMEEYKSFNCTVYLSWNGNVPSQAWTGEFDSNNWKVDTDTGIVSSSPTNNTVYILRINM